MTINVPADILIWSVPILLLGFLIGTGILRKFSRSFWFFASGFVAGLVALILFEITFSAEMAMILTSISLNRFFDSAMGKSGNTITLGTSNPLCIFGVVVITLIVVASVIDWNPKR
jgi:hypothetical protein